MGRSPVQSSPTECGGVTECGREASIQGLSSLREGIEKCFQCCGRDSSVGKNDSLRGRRSGHRIPVGQRILFLSRRYPGPTQSPAQWSLCLSRGQSGRGVMLTTHTPFSARFANRLVLYLLLPCVPAEVSHGVTFTNTEQASSL
jgi:hypothetical protein